MSMMPGNPCGRDKDFPYPIIPPRQDNANTHKLNYCDFLGFQHTKNECKICKQRYGCVPKYKTKAK